VCHDGRDHPSRRPPVEPKECTSADYRALCIELGIAQSVGRTGSCLDKAMSYARMLEREPELAAIVKQILDEAEAVDAAEDERYGDARGDELPEHLTPRSAPIPTATA
jgi:hypothetical protein